MDEIIKKEVVRKEEWEGFLQNHPESNFLQSWYWGEFHASYGHSIKRTGFYTGGKLSGVMLSIIENAKRGRYLTVPGGPILDWDNSLLVEQAILAMGRIASENACIFVRVRPQLELSEFSKNLFTKYRFRDAPMHFHAELTTQLDITKPEEELLLNMRKATRYEIRKAEKIGIHVKTTDNPDAIKGFYDLEILTAKRHGFVPFSYKFLFDQFKTFSDANKVLLYTAEFENKLLAQAYIIFYGQEAAYHYGASTEEGRKYPGAYLIQWEAIKEAKKRGLSRYNFWGVAPVEQTAHRFYGVSVFKRGFGGFDYEYLHAQDLIINKPRYMINLAIEKARKRIRHV